MSKTDMLDPIYHYTSNDVLMKILDDQSLRMSARHHLNDTQEGEQFFTLLEKHDSRPDKEKIEAVRLAFAPFEFFVTCFSSERDLLSQWRAYAGNGTGVAIGFSTQAIRAAITGSEEALLYPVTYADDCRCLPKKQENAINAILRSSGAPKESAVQALVKERWAIKPKGFSEEKEFRLIITLDVRSGCLKPSTKGLHIEYFATSSEVREYCEFRFNDFPDERFVESITLGPNNRTDETVLRRYLASKDLTDVEVHRSGISYR